MTTSDEAIQLIAYLRDHRIIGQQCWADAGETERDHEGFECAVEILDYLSWEHDMRTSGGGVGRPHVLPAPQPRSRLLAGSDWHSARSDGRMDAIPPCSPADRHSDGGLNQ